jgi:hypothetical protein
MIRVPVMVTAYLAWLAIDPSEDGKRSRIAILAHAKALAEASVPPTDEDRRIPEMVLFLQPRAETGWRSTQEMQNLGMLYWYIVKMHSKSGAEVLAKSITDFNAIVGDRFTKTLKQAREYTPSLPGVDWPAWWPGKKNKQ